MFQNLLVFTIITIAVIYLFVRIKKELFSKNEKCAGCAVGKSSQHELKKT